MRWMDLKSGDLIVLFFPKPFGGETIRQRLVLDIGPYPMWSMTEVRIAYLSISRKDSKLLEFTYPGEVSLSAVFLGRFQIFREGHLIHVSNRGVE